MSNEQNESNELMAALAGQIVGDLSAIREAAEDLASSHYLAARVELAKQFIERAPGGGVLFHSDKFEKCWSLIENESFEPMQPVTNGESVLVVNQGSN